MESCVTFTCAGDDLIGILHDGLMEGRHTGVVVVVGGPQYRVGSHRQFVLLARALACAGYPVFRFDYRGMGDSAGDARTFESVEQDVAAAVDEFVRRVPGLKSIVLFGLCDAASASLLYCRKDPRVKGLALANPWVHTEVGKARTMVRHYYWRRFLQRSFWNKLFCAGVDLQASLKDAYGSWRLSMKQRDAATGGQPGDFLRRMQEGLAQFDGSILLLLSGNDLVAKEFDDLSVESSKWRTALRRPSTTLIRIDDANHTFSSRADLEFATGVMLEWLHVLERRSAASS